MNIISKIIKLLLMLGVFFSIYAKNSYIKSDITYSNDSGSQLVYRVTNRVFDVINKKDLNNNTIELIKNIVVPHFNFTLMTKYVLASNWSTLSENEQKEITVLFKNLLVNTYSSAFYKFKGMEVTITKEEEKVKEQMTAVICQVVMSNLAESEHKEQNPITVEYDLAKPANSSLWKVYDIKIENNSLVTSYRSQFNEIIESDGVTGLIKQLQNKINATKK